jgi:hypothetical protein
LRCNDKVATQSREFAPPFRCPLGTCGSATETTSPQRLRIHVSLVLHARQSLLRRAKPSATRVSQVAPLFRTHLTLALPYPQHFHTNTPQIATLPPSLPHTSHLTLASPLHSTNRLPSQSDDSHAFSRPALHFNTTAEPTTNSHRVSSSKRQTPINCPPMASPITRPEIHPMYAVFPET